MKKEINRRLEKRKLYEMDLQIMHVFYTKVTYFAQKKGYRKMKIETKKSLVFPL